MLLLNKTMKPYLVAILLAALISCNSGSPTNSCGYDLTEQLDKIDSSISAKDPYQSMGHLRFPTEGFKADSLPILDSGFVQKFIDANYDTLTKKITRICIPLYKKSFEETSRSDCFYYDDDNYLTKIELLTYDSSPQSKASYYFHQDSLICWRTKNIEIKDLAHYTAKAKMIYSRVSIALQTKGVIE